MFQKKQKHLSYINLRLNFGQPKITFYEEGLFHIDCLTDYGVTRILFMLFENTFYFFFF